MLSSSLLSRIKATSASKRSPAVSTTKFPLILILFFASGFAGLVYEVLWMKQ